MKERRKPEYQEKILDDELQKIPYILKPEKNGAPTETRTRTWW